MDIALLREISSKVVLCNLMDTFPPMNVSTISYLLSNLYFSKHTNQKPLKSIVCDAKVCKRQENHLMNVATFTTVLL
jgi:hypothetical protein